MSATRSTGPTFPNPAPSDETRPEVTAVIAAAPHAAASPGAHGVSSVHPGMAGLPPPEPGDGHSPNPTSPGTPFTP
jgi:hypothetical protein